MQGSSVASSLEDKLLCEIWQSEFSPCFLSWTFWFCSLKTGSWFSYIPAWFIKLPSIRSHFFFPLGEYLNLTWRPDLRSAMSEASIFDICWYNKIPKSLCVSRFLMQCLEIVLNGCCHSDFWTCYFYCTPFQQEMLLESIPSSHTVSLRLRCPFQLT